MNENVSGILNLNTKDMKELTLLSTSKGNQRKWFYDDCYVKEQFYYQNKYWRDDLVEIIASAIGKSLNNDVKVLNQRPVIIEDNYNANRKTYGVISKNFCEDGEVYISYRRLLECNNTSFPEEKSYEYRYNFTLEKLNVITGLDFKEYINTMILLDYFVGNEDRHINNFGVKYKDESFIFCPLFDFGLGLFEHDDKYKNVPFRECLQMMESKPFGADNQKIMDYILKSWDLPIKKIDLTECEIPSAKAGSYIRNRCRILGVELEGV